MGSLSETREEYENTLKMAMLKGTVYEALMSLVPVVDDSILFAMLTRCKITQFITILTVSQSEDRMMDPHKKYNFKSWAHRRDLDETRTHSARRSPALIDWLSSKLMPKQIRLLDEVKGFFLTDHSGTPLVFVLRGLISPELHVRHLRQS